MLTRFSRCAVETQSRHQRGASMTEVLLLTVSLALAGISAVTLFSGSVGCNFARLGSEIAGGVDDCATAPGAGGSASGGGVPGANPSPGAPPGLGGSVLEFGEAFVAEYIEQGSALVDIVLDPVGFLTDLYELGELLLTDPQSVLEAIADEFSGDINALLYGSAAERGRLLARYLTPAQIGKALRIIKFPRSIGKDIGCASFAAGTPVWTDEASTQSIERLRLGDEVHSRSDVTFAETTRHLEATHRRIAASFVVLTIGGEYTEEIAVTPEHPFWVQGRGWTQAMLLDVGSPLATRDGEVLLRHIRRIDRQVPVYNLSVAVDVSYFVGKSALWVHNANINCNVGGAPKRKPAAGEILNSPTSFNRGSREFTLEQGTAGSGWKHIYDRHVDPDRFPNKSKFNPEMTQEDIAGLLSETLKHGKETLYQGKAVFEKRIKYNGVFKTYRATVNADGTIQTFHPLD